MNHDPLYLVVVVLLTVDQTLPRFRRLDHADWIRDCSSCREHAYYIHILSIYVPVYVLIFLDGLVCVVLAVVCIGQRQYILPTLASETDKIVSEVWCTL